MKNYPTLGIVGGAGPMASCVLYKLLIDECQKRDGCEKDKDFPKIFIINFPFSEMIQRKQSQINRMQIAAELNSCFDLLERSSVQRIGIACNTLHTFLSPDSSSQKSIVPIQLPVFQFINSRKLKRVLIMSTETTSNSNLYAGVAEEVLYPPRLFQKQLTELIQKILRGDICVEASNWMTEAIETAQTDLQFEAVVLGCTEFSVLNNLHPILSSTVTIIDPLTLLASSLLAQHC